MQYQEATKRLRQLCTCRHGMISKIQKERGARDRMAAYVWGKSRLICACKCIDSPLEVHRKLVTVTIPSHQEGWWERGLGTMVGGRPPFHRMPFFIFRILYCVHVSDHVSDLFIKSSLAGCAQVSGENSHGVLVPVLEALLSLNPVKDPSPFKGILWGGMTEPVAHPWSSPLVPPSSQGSGLWHQTHSMPPSKEEEWHLLP